MGILLMIMPATLRNTLEGDTVLISSNGGINVCFVDHASSTGFVAYHEELGVFWTPESAHIWAEGRAGKLMRSSEVSSFYFKEGLRYFIFSPLDAIKLTGRKFLLATNGAEISNNGDLDFLAADNAMLRALLRRAARALLCWNAKQLVGALARGMRASLAAA